jgi:hypothetical protein
MLPDRLSRLLTAFVDGELTSRQHKAVLRLLRRSPEARNLLRKLQLDAEAVRRLPAPALGCDLSTAVLQRIAAQESPIRRLTVMRQTSTFPAWFGVAVAAAVVLVIGLSSYLYLTALPGKEDTQASGRAPEGPIVANGRDKKRPIVSPTPRNNGGRRQLEGIIPEPPPPGPEPKETLPAPVADTIAREMLPVPQPETEVFVGPTELTPVPEKELFRTADVKVAVTFRFLALEQEKSRRELQTELHKRNAWRLDLRCLETPVAMERLRTAFKGQGIRLVVDEDAQDRLKLHLHTHYALYVENVTAEEVYAVIQDLNQADRKPGAKRRGPLQFDTLVLNALSTDDHRELSKLLGVDPTQLGAARPETPLGVDIRKPLAERTGDQVVESLKGQGTPRPEPGQPTVKGSERLAIVVSYNPIRPRPASRGVKLFLERRPEHLSGSLQILLVLRGSKG